MSSFLALEGLHVFITGAAGGIGSAAVREFLNHGCKVTAHDIRRQPAATSEEWLFTVSGDISDEASICSCIDKARARFGPINILVANAGITDESAEFPIWEMPLELWEKTYRTNVRGTFLTIKHFLSAANKDQLSSVSQLENLAIVVTGSECGKFGQAGHAEYASGKAGLQYGLVRTVKNEIVKLNSRARINAVAPGWVDTALIGDRLEDPVEMWAEAQATVPLRKIAQPADVACAIVFLASHKAAGHISGQCISVDGGMEGRLLWRDTNAVEGSTTRQQVYPTTTTPLTAVRRPLTPAAAGPRIRILLSINLDILDPRYTSSLQRPPQQTNLPLQLFVKRSGFRRLLSLLRKYDILAETTWFVPGMILTSNNNNEIIKPLIDSGAEIAIFGQRPGTKILERQQTMLGDTLTNIESRLSQWRRPLGFRSRSVLTGEMEQCLRGWGFQYDSSRNFITSSDTSLRLPRRHDPNNPAAAVLVSVPNEPSFSDWPSANAVRSPVIHNPESAPYSPSDLPQAMLASPAAFAAAASADHTAVDPYAIERAWRDRFEWIAAHENSRGDAVFPLVLHPEVSGTLHFAGMLDRLLGWLDAKRRRREVEFVTCDHAAREAAEEYAEWVFKEG